jgi:hypothetical protein
MCLMLSAVQIHDPMPLRETVPERLGDFLRFPDILEVNLQVATLVEGVATPHATPLTSGSYGSLS